MASLTNFSVTLGGAVQVNATDKVISCQVVTDDASATLIADFTGDNALHWPAVLNTLAPVDQATLFTQVVNTLILMKAGVYNG